MAKKFSATTTTILSLAILISFSSVVSSSTTITSQEKKNMMMGLKKEKLSHFKFFWHDQYSGKNPTAVTVVPAPKNDTSFFGSVTMIDDALTERADPNSRLLGRAQGLYGSASRGQVALIMAMNFHFVKGKYNGSGITILGRNPVFDKVREMPVIAGTGLFRFARGFARASTVSFDLATGDAVVEYNVYVLHYG